MKTNQKNKSKKVLKENAELIQSFVNWFTENWNDVSHFTDSAGSSDLSKGEYFKQDFYMICTALGIGTGIGVKMMVKNLFDKSKAKVKELITIGKINKNASSREEAESKMSEMGLAYKETVSAQPAMTMESKRLKKVLTLIEAQVDRESSKKKSLIKRK